MRYLDPNLTTVMSAKTDVGVGNTLDVTKDEFVTLEVAGNATCNMVVKLSGSISDAKPTFSSAATAANAWDYIGCYDLQSGSFVAGDTGLTIGNNEVRLIKVNVDLLKWLTAEITTATAGGLTIKKLGASSTR